MTTPATIDFSTIFTGIQATIMGAFVTIVPLAMSIYGTLFALKAGKQLFSHLGKA